MDFAKHDRRAAVEDARPMQFREPATGEPIFDPRTGLPCNVLLRGFASRSVQGQIKAEQRSKAQAVKKGGPDQVRATEDWHKELVRQAARLVVGFENIEWNGEPATPEHAEALLDTTFLSLPHLLAKDEDRDDGTWRRPSFAQQIIDFAQDEANWLGESDAA